MAIDTAAKRKSAVHVASPWRGELPFPDGTISQGDRQTVAFMYSGILATAAAAIAFGRLEYTMPYLTQFTMPHQPLEFTMPPLGDETIGEP